MKPSLLKISAALLILLGSSSTALATDWMQQAKGALESIKASSNGTTLSSTDIVHGLKDALRVGSGTVVGKLSKKDAFNKNPAIHIPLPEKMKKVKSVMAKVGMEKSMVDLETRLNRAAENATPKAKKIFIQAIKNMSFSDAKRILSGPDDAATRYLEKQMNSPLQQAMKPVISQSLSEVGAIRAYDNIMGKYKSMPFVPDIKADLTAHVVTKSLHGIFTYLAKEESEIRKNPAKRTTELLKKVFK